MLQPPAQQIPYLDKLVLCCVECVGRYVHLYLHFVQKVRIEFMEDDCGVLGSRGPELIESFYPPTNPVIESLQQSE